MPNSFKIEFNIQVPISELFSKLTAVESIGKLRKSEVQTDQRRILFINPPTWIRQGQNVLVFLFDNEKGGTRIVVNSSCCTVSQLFDFGQNQKNCIAVRDQIYLLLKP